MRRKKWIVIIGLVAAVLAVGAALLWRFAPRILTPLTPGAHTPYVRLRDGYLHFTEASCNSLIDYGVDGKSGSLSYEEAIQALGFAPADALASLPARLQFEESNLQTDVIFLNEDHSVFGGYEFCKSGDTVDEKFQLTEKLILRYQYRGKILTHTGNGCFCVLPWERLDATGTEAFRARYLGETTEYHKSRVGSVEVGVLYENQPPAIAPDAPSEYYYAGFYVGDLAITLESHYGYCTQEEFIQVLLAILDAAVAAHGT